MRPRTKKKRKIFSAEALRVDGEDARKDLAKSRNPLWAEEVSAVGGLPVARAAGPQAQAPRSAAARVLVAGHRWEAPEAPQPRGLEAPLAVALRPLPSPEAVHPGEAAGQPLAARRAEAPRVTAREKRAEAPHPDRRVALRAAGNRAQRKRLLPVKAASPARPHAKLLADGKVAQKRGARGSRLVAERRHLRAEVGRPGPRHTLNRPREAAVGRRARGPVPGARFPYPVRSAQSAVTLK
jgi:hypothetical protein